MRVALTDLAIKNAVPLRRGEKLLRREIADSKLPGLFLIVQPSGHKSFALRYRFEGRKRKYTIGTYPETKLIVARQKGQQELANKALGKDPAAAKREARDDSVTFGNVWDLFIQSPTRKGPRKESYLNELKRLYKVEISPTFKNRRLKDITESQVAALLDRLVERKRASASKTATTANRVHSALRGFFNFAVKKKRLSASPMDGIERPTEETERSRVLTDEEIRWLWRATQEDGAPFGTMIRLLLLTGARRDEVRQMTDREVSTREKKWTVTASRTKNHREHLIPLSKLALEVISTVPRVKNEAGLIFCTNGKTPVSGFSRSKRRIDSLLLKYAKEEAAARGDNAEAVFLKEWRLHDLRRTMVTNMGRLGVNMAVVAKCINHVTESGKKGAMKHYHHYEYEAECRDAFQKWHDLIIRVASNTPTATVIPIKRLIGK